MSHAYEESTVMKHPHSALALFFCVFASVVVLSLSVRLPGRGGDAQIRCMLPQTSPKAR